MQRLRWSFLSLVKLTGRSGSQAMAVPTGRSVPACERVECGWPPWVVWPLDSDQRLGAVERGGGEQLWWGWEMCQVGFASLETQRGVRQRKGDRHREIQISIFLIICLLMINPVESGYTSLHKAVYISQMSKLLYKTNVGCCENY